MRAEELSERLAERFPARVVAHDELTVIVERDDLVDALTQLRDQGDLGFLSLSDLSATDCG